MSERAKLLRAIWDDPADDTVRLAYADYLDENGLTPHHAALIRGQVGGTFPAVELQTALLPGENGFVWHSANVYLDPRQDAIRVFNEMLGAPPGWAIMLQAFRLYVRRGFPDELRIPAAWLSQFCPICDGGGVLATDRGALAALVGTFAATSMAPTHPCVTCKGKGCVPGPAVEMFRFPITKVAYTDKEPGNTRRKGGGGPNSRRHTWWQYERGNWGDIDRQDAHWLPSELFPGPPERRRANYPHKADALKTASDKAVGYGRAQWLKT